MDRAYPHCPECLDLFFPDVWAEFDFNMDGSVRRTVTCQECGFKYDEVFVFSHNEDYDTHEKMKGY